MILPIMWPVLVASFREETQTICFFLFLFYNFTSLLTFNDQFELLLLFYLLFTRSFSSSFFCEIKNVVFCERFVQCVTSPCLLIRALTTVNASGRPVFVVLPASFSLFFLDILKELYFDVCLNVNSVYVAVK